MIHFSMGLMNCRNIDLLEYSKFLNFRACHESKPVLSLRPFSLLRPPRWKSIKTLFFRQLLKLPAYVINQDTKPKFQLWKSEVFVSCPCDIIDMVRNMCEGNEHFLLMGQLCKNQELKYLIVIRWCHRKTDYITLEGSNDMKTAISNESSTRVR